jgi:flagellin
VDTTTNNTLTFAIDGPSTFSVTLPVGDQGAGTSKGQIAADLNANGSFAAKATAYVKGNQLVVQSKTNGSNSSVTVTGNLATPLGFSGTATAASASTGADLSTQVQGQSALSATANAVGNETSATKTIDATNNKLYLAVGTSGAQTLTLTQGTNLTKADIAADINAQITANGNFTGANAVTAKVVNNAIVLEANKAGSNVIVSGGATNVNTALGLTAATYNNHTSTTSDTITLRFQGAGLTSPVDITLAPTVAGTSNSASILADLQTKISGSSALTGAGITLSSGTVGNNLVFTSSKGDQFQVVATGDTTNQLGLGSFLAGANGAVDYNLITAGSAYSTTAASGTANFQFSLNGKASSGNIISADLTGGDATAAAQTGTVVYAAGVVDLSGSTGSDKLSLRIDGGTTIQTAALGTSGTTSISSILGAINTALTGAGSTATATLDGSGNLVIKSGTKGSNSTVEVVADDAAITTALGLTPGNQTHGLNATEGNVIEQLNNSIAGNSTLTAAGLKAVDNAGSVQFTSTNGTYFRLNAYGAGNAGFGNSGASFTGNSQTAAPASSPYFDAQGSNATASLAYNDTLYGTDTQTVNVTANDTAGAKHTLSVAIGNNGSNRQQTIDQALSAINTQLQQSNDATLKQIVAVKEESGGTQSIKFLSTVKGFQVTVGTDPNGTGITPPTGNQTTATVQGTGASADISDINGAQAAVTALGIATANLGKAQAVIGRGQNQLNYAINLASSQLTNLAAAESRIRDADLASESANLTKSQLLLQAGIAALAQANSAPQQVLKLLQ